MAIMSDEYALMNRRVDLLHIHVCIHCGHLRPRKDVQNLEVTSGMRNYFTHAGDPSDEKKEPLSRTLVPGLPDGDLRDRKHARHR